jgi:arsenical pump membrane protein
LAFREISWTLALVAGFFLMVDAVERVGAMAYTRAWLSSVETMAPSLGALFIAFVVAIANNLVNNLPLGLIAGSTLQAANAKGLLASAVLLGVDLGPNLSITGSLATILWLIALRRERLDVSFWSFLKIGVMAMPVALYWRSAARSSCIYRLGQINFVQLKSFSKRAGIRMPAKLLGHR